MYINYKVKIGFSPFMVDVISTLVVLVQNLGTTTSPSTVTSTAGGIHNTPRKRKQLLEWNNHTPQENTNFWVDNSTP